MADNGTMATTTADSPETDRSRDNKVHHTVTACVRCRQRKTRCDPRLPACDPCQRSNAHCEYYDSAKNRVVPRKYIVDLQIAVKHLQAELKILEKEDEDFEADHESMARAPGLVKFSESNDSRFLGPSSGIAVTRFVMDFARKHADRKTIRNVVPDHAVQEVKQTNTAESVKPTSKVYPLISSVAAPTLPQRGLMDQLLEIYNCKAQYMSPLLHEPSFRQDVDAVYNGSTDPTLNFQLRLVIAISMQKLDTQYAGLADSYYLAALPYLTEAIRRKDISTLQCFVLIGQYSLLTPTRTAAYWVVGMAAKLCQDLGLCDEMTIDKPSLAPRPNFLEIDMRRRLFWIVTSMEYGLSHSLGRPSAFGTTVDNINVGWFQLCDDSFITSQGLRPGHQPIMKKCIAIHFLKMRLLQAGIRKTLYLRKREAPLTDRDPWFQATLNSIDQWMSNNPKSDEGSGLSPAWFEGRKNTMIVMLYRPTPQIPNPSPRAAELCYQAAVFNIGLQKTQIERRLIDITWIFTQAIFMALNTVLWSISYPEIRAQHPVEEVQSHMQECLEAIRMCADRWPGVHSAHRLYGNLIAACLRAYDLQAAGSPASGRLGVVSADNSTSASTSQVAHSPVSTAASSMQGPQSPQSSSSYPSMMSSAAHTQSGLAYDYIPGSVSQQNISGMSSAQQYNHYHSTSPSEAPLLFHSPQYNGPSPLHIPATTQELPSWDTITTTAFSSAGPSFKEMPLDGSPWLAPYGSEYSPYSQISGSMSYQMQSLNEQDQLDLLAALEQTQLPDVSSLGGDSTVFYTPGLP